MKYHKIHTIYKRDPATNFKTLLTNEYSRPEFDMLAESPIWTLQEKIDGTNIRAIWDGENWEFRGKTDKATIPDFLLSDLQSLFSEQKAKEVLEGPITLYGEGYGNRIQSVGKHYIKDRCSFLLFDCWAGMWLERNSVWEIARKLGLFCPAIVGTGYTLSGAAALAKQGFKSLHGDCQAEGLIIRPEQELLDRRGYRIITKIKTKDYENTT